jgi:hypothetical protein
MNDHLERIKKNIEPLKQQIINHKVYSAIKDFDDLKIFMQYHVVAVWDFMSLLKTLQNNLTCTAVPWFPTGSAETRYLINEIVVGEESDVDSFGNRKSHFELYLDAMQQCGANTLQINTFIEVLKESKSFEAAFSAANLPKESCEFINFTFSIIHSNKAYLQSAIFTFGREDLIPGMFMSLVNDIHKHAPQTISIFKYYLERHIEIDGDHHSHLALQMTSSLCGSNDDFWEEAYQATKVSLEKRIALWDAVHAKILEQKHHTS